MLETHIKILASFYTALLITVVVSMLLFGGFKFKSPLVKGKAITATMVDISQLKPRKKSQVKKQQPVKNTPVKTIEKKPVQPIKKDPVKKNPPKVIKKTPKIDTKALDLERKKRIERQKKLKEIRKKRLEAEKRRKIEEQKLKDLANKTKEIKAKPVVDPIGSTQGTTQANKLNQLMARWQLAVISKVEKQWNKPASANSDLICHVRVRQIPGGGVIDATIVSPCNANSIVKKSIIAAINKADPLPYKGFEQVFDRAAIFIFQPKE